MTAVALALATTSLAAQVGDHYRKAPPAPAPAAAPLCGWSGFYVGADHAQDYRHEEKRQVGPPDEGASATSAQTRPMIGARMVVPRVEHGAAGAQRARRRERERYQRDGRSARERP